MPAARQLPNLIRGTKARRLEQTQSGDRWIVDFAFLEPIDGIGGGTRNGLLHSDRQSAEAHVEHLARLAGHGRARPDLVRQFVRQGVHAFQLQEAASGAVLEQVGPGRDPG